MVGILRKKEAIMEDYIPSFLPVTGFEVSFREEFIDQPLKMFHQTLQVFVDSGVL